MFNHKTFTKYYGSFSVNLFQAHEKFSLGRIVLFKILKVFATLEQHVYEYDQYSLLIKEYLHWTLTVLFNF